MRDRPIVAAVSGMKNSGKTTLMEKLIRELSRRKMDLVDELKYKKGRSAKSAIAEAKASGTFYRKASQVKNAGRRR